LQAWEDLTTGSGYSSEVGMQLADISTYLTSKGLGHMPKPMYWLNGLLNPISADLGQANNELGFAMMMEVQAMQEHVYFNRQAGLGGLDAALPWRLLVLQPAPASTAELSWLMCKSLMGKACSCAACRSPLPYAVGLSFSALGSHFTEHVASCRLHVSCLLDCCKLLLHHVAAADLMLMSLC
jgi:hypothetical protein